VTPPPGCPEGLWAHRLATAERLAALLEKGGLPAGRVGIDDVLPVVAARPAHPVVAELIDGWGVEGVVERLVVCCRAAPAVQRGELRTVRLARRLEDAVRELTRVRSSVPDSPAMDRLTEPAVEAAPSPAIERFVSDRVDTLEAVVGRALPGSDRTVVEDVLHTTVDFAATVAARLPAGERVLDVFGQPSSRTPTGRRLLPHLRRYWPEVPDPTLTALHRLVRYQLLDPAHLPGRVEPAVVRRWRSCYPALHRPIALRIARQQQHQDYEASRRLRLRAVRGDWAVLDAALADARPVPGLAA